MSEILCSGIVDNLTDLIEHSQFPEDALFLGEQFPQHIVQAVEQEGLLRLTHFDRSLPFVQYTSGRIFHETFEFRWKKKENGKTQGVYLGESEHSPSVLGDHCPPIEDCYTKITPPKYYYLYGIRVSPSVLKEHNLKEPVGEGYFTEGRIPRLLRYPVLVCYPGLAEEAEKERVQVGVYEYIHNKTGRLGLFRFCSLSSRIGNTKDESI